MSTRRIFLYFALALAAHAAAGAIAAQVIT